MVSVVTTTYAWISLATVNVISSIELGAKQNIELELSVDGINYYKNLPGDLILANMQKLKLTTLTSNDGINFNTLTSFEKEAVENEDYMRFEFYFRTKDKRYREVHLTNHLKNVSFNDKVEGTYITSKGKYFEPKVDYLNGENELVEAGTVLKQHASEAIRVSFTSDDLDKPKIFDLSNNPNRGFGYKYGALDYYYKAEGVLLTPPEGPEVVTKMSEFDEIDPVALNDTSYLLTLEKNGNDEYYRGNVLVHVWLEGWDADAYDAIYKDIIKIQFEFTGKMVYDELYG